MAKHCQDPHCGNFAPKDSDWCRKHAPEHLAEIPLADWERQIQAGLLGVQPQSEAFAHFHDGPEPVLSPEDQVAFGMRHIEERYGDPDRAWLGGVEIQPTGEFRKLGDPTQARQTTSEQFVSGFIGTERVRPIETDYNIPRDADPHGVFEEISQETGYRHFDAAEPVLTDEQRRWLAEMTPAEKFAVVQSAVDGAKRGRRKHRAPQTGRRGWRRMFGR